MLILRLTASLSIASLAGAIAPLWLASNALGQPTLQGQTAPALISQVPTGTSSPTTDPTTAQTTTTGQTAGASQPANTSTPGNTLQTPGADLASPGTIQPAPGSTLQTPGSGLSSPGATQTTNGTGTGQSSSAPTGTTGTTQVTPPTTTGITQTPLNGQSTVNQAAPGVNGQVSPGSVLSPPQLIQGSGTSAPATQPATGTGIGAGTATGTVPIQPQTAPGTAATRTVAPSSIQPTTTQLQPGQGALDAALQQATCAQNWQQAIQVVNTAIAATPTAQAGYRSQLIMYRNRLQTLQVKSVRAPNWAQQCRGGAVATQ